MERRAIAIAGVVQGVGFRPFVFRIANRFGLGGFVRNEVGNVLVEVEGETRDVERFLEELTTRPPPLARIERIEWLVQPPRGENRFQIQPSAPGVSGNIFVSPDIATCDDCLAELFDPRDRRYRYPFINCTHCGPRLTIVTGAPYDRDRTTMSGFQMCRRCREEYDNPRDRRFHAQPTACAVCGPRLIFRDAGGIAIAAAEPLAELAAAIKDGKIAAIKGLGGYHLACDARKSRAVSELRRRKHRDEKPLAIMAADMAAVRSVCDATSAELELLASPQRPIVLMQKLSATGLAEEIAPGNPLLGVMLPYTPLHHLLLHEMDGASLVMTSGNRSDEPIAYDDSDAVQRLCRIADVFLTHDRPIHVRCDDSVTRVVNCAESPVRRSRGYAPQPIALPVTCPEPILAVGGQLKNTFALGREGQAILSHHLGDLDHLQALAAFERDIELFENLFDVNPKWLVHDLHPDYASTRYALKRRERSGTPCIGVQHHHAHMCSCMAEHGLNEQVIGVSFDGTGYGADGAVWGGEFLVGDFRGFHRAAHLRYVGMPGGERAIREPWRMALAHLRDAGAESERLVGRLPRESITTVDRMLERQFNSPLTSSAGRLFDAIACLAGVRGQVSFEGQAAMELEWLAGGVTDDGAYPIELGDSGEMSPIVIDTRPIIHAVAADVRSGVSSSTVSRRFHETMALTISRVCLAIRRYCGVQKVVLSGGVFMNALLSSAASKALTKDGFVVHCQRQAPPNDGGLSLGQVAIAAAQIAARASGCYM